MERYQAHRETADVLAVVRVPSASADALQVELVPQLGAKVTSIRLGSGREWLAPPLRPLARPGGSNQDWAELDCSGWDECFPNVAPSRELGLLDHGEVWRRPWTVRLTDDGVLTQIACNRYRFARTLSVTGNRLTASYLLHNVGAHRMNWAWAQHPLLAVSEQSCLVLPESARVRVDSAFVGGKQTAGVEWLGPAATLAPETGLSVVQGRAAKIWFEHPHPSFVGVRHGEEWLVWRIGDSSVRDLGLWVNLGGWGPEPCAHLAVEPAFGASDNAEVSFAAASSSDGWSLAAGARRSWRVVIEAGRGVAALATLMNREQN